MQNLQHTDAALAAIAASRLSAIADPAARLRAIARLRGVSLAHLAREAGIRYARLEAVLNGRREARGDELDRIAAALGLASLIRAAELAAEIKADTPGGRA